MKEMTYEQHIEGTRKAIMLRIEQSRAHTPGSREYNAYLGTAETILTGLLRNVEVADANESRLRGLIDAERAD